MNRNKPGPLLREGSASDVVINANRLNAGPGFLVRGGGLYTLGPVQRTHTVIAGNKPDDCFGC